MSEPSQLYRLVEERIQGTLPQYVAANRATLSWRAMASDLHERTGIRVSHQTLRLWFNHRITVKTQIEVAA